MDKTKGGMPKAKLSIIQQAMQMVKELGLGLGLGEVTVLNLSHHLPKTDEETGQQMQQGPIR